MSVVIDASALVAFVTKEPASPKVAQLLHDWGSQETPLNAPELAHYEIANALAKKAANGELDDDAIDEAWDVLDDLPIVYHPLHDGSSAVRVALALERRSAMSHTDVSEKPSKPLVIQNRIDVPRLDVPRP